MDGDVLIWVSGFASVALVIVTTVYVLFTNRLVEAQTSPILDAGITLATATTKALDVFIQNVGPGVALGVNIKVNDDFEFLVGDTLKRFSSLPTVTNEIKRLAPGQKRSLAIIPLSPDNDPERTGGVAARMNKPCEVVVTYKNARGKTFEEPYVLDFPYYHKLLSWRSF